MGSLTTCIASLGQTTAAPQELKYFDFVLIEQCHQLAAPQLQLTIYACCEALRAVPGFLSTDSRLSPSTTQLASWGQMQMLYGNIAPEELANESSAADMHCSWSNTLPYAGRICASALYERSTAATQMYLSNSAGKEPSSQPQHSALDVITSTSCLCHHEHFRQPCGYSQNLHLCTRLLKSH